jgi:D-arabinan exo alpha-(1,3)/(1,5)-arabinofuranosidase (non-reducing end)
LKRRTFLRNTGIQIATIAGAGLARVKVEGLEGTGSTASATWREDTPGAKTEHPAALTHRDTSIPDPVREPYLLHTGVRSRSISFENPTGAPGQGGIAASALGVGRKGAPSRKIQPGETVALGDIEGPGMIRHFWMTTSNVKNHLRSVVVRAYWEGQDHPSIECPLSDLMGFAHAKVTAYQSAVHSVSSARGMNLWLPMPFTKRASITFSNEGDKPVTLFYQIDYTLGDKHSHDVGRLHCLFRRENPTTLKQDFELLPQRRGSGRFIGSVVGVHALSSGWWGEGEIKMYFDGDKGFPSYCGTGTEDYAGQGWGVQPSPYLYNGCSLSDNSFYSFYRWYLPDPIYWQKEGRITIQQIGYKKGFGLVDRSDDWSCATFWYEPSPSAPLPPMPDLAARTADLWSPAISNTNAAPNE